MGARKATMLACDNPSCDFEMETTKEDPAYGYHLTGAIHMEWGGGPIPKTFACSPECIEPAIEATVKEAWGTR